MNWGIRIALFYGAFVVMIVGFVIAASHQKFDLVTPDYYGAEQQFGKQYEATQNALSLAEKPTFSREGDGSLRITFPESLRAATGSVTIYSPLAAANDRSLPLKINADGSCFVPAAQLPQGKSTAQLSFSLNGKTYYLESVVLN